MSTALRSVAILTLWVGPTFAAVWYVDKDNVSGTEDGLGWSTAFTRLQPAIDAASDAGGGEVWVAEGVYDEARSATVPSISTSRGALIMKRNAHLYGGFSGSEIDRDERNWESHITTIDGSHARGTEAALHVVIGADEATLDGFVITRGYNYDPDNLIAVHNVRGARSRR